LLTDGEKVINKEALFSVAIVICQGIEFPSGSIIPRMFHHNVQQSLCFSQLLIVKFHLKMDIPVKRNKKGRKLIAAPQDWML